MPTVQSYGGVPSGGNENWASLLASGILGNQKYQELQQSRKDKDREFQQKQDEFALRQQELKDNRDNQADLKKSQMWLNANAQAEKTVQDALNSGTLVQGDTKAIDAYRNKTLMALIGLNPNGSMSSHAYDNLAPEAKSFADQFKVSNTANPNVNKKGTTYSPQMFMPQGKSNNPLLAAGGLGAGGIAAWLNAMKNGVPSGVPSGPGNPFVGGSMPGINNASDAYQGAVNSLRAPLSQLPMSATEKGASLIQQMPEYGIRNMVTSKPDVPLTATERWAARGGGGGAMGVAGPVFGGLQDRLGTMQALQALMNAMNPQGQQQNSQDWQNSLQT